MENKINKIKRELRAVKKSSHAIGRLIEHQGLHFTRIRALEALPKDEERDAIIERERELIEKMGLEELISQNEEMEKKYEKALESLSLRDRAMMKDCYFGGMPYWKIAMEYGFSEEGARKHLEKLVVKISKVVQ